MEVWVVLLPPTEMVTGVGHHADEPAFNTPFAAKVLEVLSCREERILHRVFCLGFGSAIASADLKEASTVATRHAVEGLEVIGSHQHDELIGIAVVNGEAEGRVLGLSGRDGHDVNIT